MKGVGSLRDIYDGLSPGERYFQVLEAKARDDDAALDALFGAPAMKDLMYVERYRSFQFMTQTVILTMTPLLLHPMILLEGLGSFVMGRSSPETRPLERLTVDLRLTGREAEAVGERITCDGKWGERAAKLRLRMNHQTNRGRLPGEAARFTNALLRAGGIWHGLSRFAHKAWALDPINVLQAEAPDLAELVRRGLPLLQQLPFDPLAAEQMEHALTEIWEQGFN
jgi:hypothetical protein